MTSDANPSVRPVPFQPLTASCRYAPKRLKFVDDAKEVTYMWRSIFLAIGITLCILGAECLVIEEAVIAKSGPLHAAIGGSDSLPKQIKTREWMPWTFLSAGAVTILYTITLPKRFQG
jgi:hypothetical protein